MKDPIERQDIIKELESWLKVDGYSEGELNIIKAVLYELQSLPSAQPEPAIPISWIEEEIKRLESRKSSFAVLDAVQLKALIKRWESEQNETD